MKKIPRNMLSFIDIGTYGVPPSNVEINAFNVYGQSFMANFNNLDMMSIFVPAQNLDSQKELIFHLKSDKDSKDDLVRIRWRYDQVRFDRGNFYIIPPDREDTDKGFHFHFSFPVIKNSEDKMFYFYFESPEAKEGEGIKIGLWNNRHYYEAMQSGELFINGIPANGFLAFRTYHTYLGSLGDLCRQIRFRLGMDRDFLMFYILLVSLISAGLVLVGFKKNI